MEKEKHPEQTNPAPEIDIHAKPDKKRTDEKIDEQIDQSFPASDPPSYSQPGNDDVKEGGDQRMKEDGKEKKCEGDPEDRGV